jgi:hypothetical protein
MDIERMDRNSTRFGCSFIYWATIFPARVLGELFLLFFDGVLSRHLVAGAICACIWVPCYLLFDADPLTFWMPTLLLGTCLCGLWEGCRILSLSAWLGRD